MLAAALLDMQLRDIVLHAVKKKGQGAEVSDGIGLVRQDLKKPILELCQS
jgi:hypothetical protein